MNARYVFALLFFLFIFPGKSRSQIKAEVALPEGRATAGQSIDMTLTLDTPVTCDTSVTVWFYTDPPDSDSFTARGSISDGQTVASVHADLPKDLVGGTYRSTQASLNPCQGYQYSTKFSVPARTLIVSKFIEPTPVKVPSKADLVLTLPQENFFETKAAEIDDLSGQVDAHLDKSTSDLEDLRMFLITIVNSADGALATTRDQYSKQIMHSQGATPYFFAEFHARYSALLVELKAPIPGTKSKNVSEQGARLVYAAQLKKRTTPPSTSAHSTDNTAPPAAVAVDAALKDNSAAYRYAESGRLTFNVHIESFPPGAAILSKKLLDRDFQDLGNTDTDAKLELATWIFKFHKNGCPTDPVRRIDPYQDVHPVSVEFSGCKVK